MKKSVKAVALAIASTMLFATPTFADNWKWTSEKWFYENTEGDWKQTDGNPVGVQIDVNDLDRIY